MTMPTLDQVWTISLAVVSFLAALAAVGAAFVTLIRIAMNIAMEPLLDGISTKIDDVNRTLSTKIDKVDDKIDGVNKLLRRRIIV